MLAIMGPALASVPYPLFRPALALAGIEPGDNFAASITGRGRSLVVALSLQRVADRAVRAVTHRA
jgi:hypothetical protein